MINVSKHIYDLLFEHDCVIIPNFGGFVANYAPSKYDSSKNIITPPKKHLLFNKNLINNDGLLVHRVSALEQLSYDQALKVVQEYSSSLLSQLNAAKRIELSGVGILFLSDNQYRFKSDERARIYLTNALEPAQDFSGTFAFAIPALARESDAVNKIKKKQRFTVIIGNPPYSIIFFIDQSK